MQNNKYVNIMNTYVLNQIQLKNIGEKRMQKYVENGTFCTKRFIHDLKKFGVEIETLERKNKQILIVKFNNDRYMLVLDNLLCHYSIYTISDEYFNVYFDGRYVQGFETYTEAVTFISDSVLDKFEVDALQSFEEFFDNYIMVHYEIKYEKKE